MLPNLDIKHVKMLLLVIAGIGAFTAAPFPVVAQNTQWSMNSNQCVATTTHHGANWCQIVVHQSTATPVQRCFDFARNDPNAVVRVMVRHSSGADVFLDLGSQQQLNAVCNNNIWIDIEQGRPGTASGTYRPNP